MIPANHPLANIDGAFNGIYLKGNAVGPVMLYGMGAGMMPTASAVVADLIDIARNMNTGAAQRIPALSYADCAVRPVDIKATDSLEIPYYMRFLAADKPGVLSNISGVLGRHDISISSVIQRDRKIGGSVALVILTHHAVEKELMAALGEIEKMDTIHEKPVYIRIEENLGAAN
jgi:homoserine dehydrogenase